MRRGLRIAKWGAGLALIGLSVAAGLPLVRENYTEAPKALGWVRGHVTRGQPLGTVLPAFAERGFTCRDGTTAARRNDPGIRRLTICSKAVRENFAQVRDISASLRSDEHGRIVAVVATMTRTTL